MSNPIEDKNKKNNNKNQQIKKNEEYKNIAAKLNYFIEFELIDVFKNILNEPKIDFLASIMVKVKNYLFMEYNNRTFKEEMLKYLLKHSQERLEKKYDIHMKNLSSAWKNFQILKKSKNKTNEIEIDNNYLKNFVFHCSSISEYAIHKCEKNEKIVGKFIKVIDKSNNKNLYRYVICENCRKAYFIEHFLNYCEKCEISYYSCEISAEKKYLLPATLRNPHCEPVVNEKLHCQFCKNILYLNIKTNQIKCQNCRFVARANNLDWNCHVCSKKFKSDIIVYNRSEVNYIKKVINYGLLLKKMARPVKLACCKNINVKTTEFYHKKDCKGIIYFAEFHKKLIIICEKCKAVNNFAKFIWTCPGCSLRFKDMKWKENEPRLRKEIFNKKDIKINIDLNKEEENENTKNLEFDEMETIETKSRGKNKSNLYDILKKRINIFGETNSAENSNFITQKKEKKNISAEEIELNNNRNIEAYSDNPLSDLIKVKRNLVYTNGNNKTEINSNKKKNNNESIKVDDDSTDRKNLKKRYIFDKLIRRQFVSANNIMINKLMAEESHNKSEKNIHERLQIKDENDKENNENPIRKICKYDSTEIKPNPLQIIQISQSNTDINRESKNNRMKKMNKENLEELNYQTINKNGYQRNYPNIYREQKSVDKMVNNNIPNNFQDFLQEQRSSDIEKKKYYKIGQIKTSLKENEINNKKNLLKFKEQNNHNINVKRYLFKPKNEDENEKVNNNKISNYQHNDINHSNNNQCNNNIHNFNHIKNNNQNNINPNFISNTSNHKNNNSIIYKNINSKKYISNENNKYINNINGNKSNNNNKDNINKNKYISNNNIKNNNNRNEIINKNINDNRNHNINHKIEKDNNNKNKNNYDNNAIKNDNKNNNILYKSIHINNNNKNNNNNFIHHMNYSINYNSSPNYNINPNNNKPKENNNIIKKENKINNNSNKNDEKEIKINKRIVYKESKLINKMSDNEGKDNKENHSNQKELIHHCALNNIGLRKIYKDAYVKIDKNLVAESDSKNNSSKNNEVKIPLNFNYNNYISNKNNINIHNNQNNNYNNSNSNYKSNNYKNNENSYSSSSMKNIKNNPNNQNEEKPKYDNNTFRNRKEKNINLLKIEQKKEEPEEEPPDDIKKVLCIDDMETIPLNPTIFKNSLICNNIQQRIKHLLFRGKLPLFDVDNYTIKKTLGEGTNGIIYEVTNNKTKKNYAMKKLLANTLAELDFYQKEFKICYENPHPYILTIYGVCARCFDSTTFVLYVLMALAQKDLEMEISDRIKTKKYFQEKELIDMLKKLVEALSYLQKEKNVAHRDIKPENILIFKNGVVKLADFGEAKINDEHRKKTVRGTEFYMSPLLYAGNLESKYDIQHNPFKSDVFSLGYCFIYASSLDYEIINEMRKSSDQIKLRQILKNHFPKMYSTRYIDLLLKMIINEENQRVDFIGLQKILENY